MASTTGAIAAPISNKHDFTQGGGVSKFALANVSGTTTKQISKGSGRLMRILVTVAGGGTNGWTFYDGTDNTGTIIGIVPKAAAIGTVYDLRMPVDTGIYAAADGANAPGLTGSFS